LPGLRHSSGLSENSTKPKPLRDRGPSERAGCWTSITSHDSESGDDRQIPYFRSIEPSGAVGLQNLQKSPGFGTVSDGTEIVKFMPAWTRELQDRGSKKRELRQIVRR
jgi:hypothetical protein